MHYRIASPYQAMAPGVTMYNMAGLGQTDPAPPPPASTSESSDALAPIGVIGGGAILLYFVIAGAVNWQLGAAMAPDKQSRSKWGWGNAIAGTIFPPVTLGLAIYKNYIR